MIEFQTSVAKVSVDFKDKINILLGDSGEGKSLLLAVYFREHNIPFDTVDWNTSEEALRKYVKIEWFVPIVRQW